MVMQLSDLLSLDCTACAVQGHSKKRILELISQIAHQHDPSLDEKEILTSLLQREKVGSTGIGGGIAIPHGRLSNIHQAIAIFITCKDGIGYDAIDEKPVDIFFALLVPTEQCEAHLHTLAVVAKQLSDEGRLKRIRDAGSDQQLYDAFINTN